MSSLLMPRFNVHDGEKHRLTFRALDWEKGPAVDEVLGECFMELDCMSSSALGCICYCVCSACVRIRVYILRIVVSSILNHCIALVCMCYRVSLRVCGRKAHTYDGSVMSIVNHCVSMLTDVDCTQIIRAKSCLSMLHAPDP